MNILQLDRVSFVPRSGVTETTASAFKGETQSSLALWALGHKPQWFSSADIRKPVSLMLVPGVGMPCMEQKPFLWEKLKPVRSLAVEVTTWDGVLMHPHLCLSYPSRHGAFIPGCAGVVQPIFGSFSEDTIPVVPRAAEICCVLGAGRGMLEFRMFPCRRLGLPSHFHLNWYDYALLQEPICVSVSVLFTCSYCG